MKYIIIMLMWPFLVHGQIENCGKRENLTVIEESEYTPARGVISPSATWKFSKVFYFNQAGAAENITLGIGTTETTAIDTMYILGRDIISPTVIEYEGTRALIYPWNYDTFQENITRSQVAAIPVPKYEINCPDTVWSAFELWYDTNGNARYKRRGNVYQYYSETTNDIEKIVDQKIKNRPCYTINESNNVRAKSEKDIVIKNGYCTGLIDDKVKIELVRGEILEYENVKVKDDIITFKNNDFKIRFAPGTVRLKYKTGAITFVSNTQWN